MTSTCNSVKGEIEEEEWDRFLVIASTGRTTVVQTWSRFTMAILVYMIGFSIKQEVVSSKASENINLSENIFAEVTGYSGTEEISTSLDTALISSECFMLLHYCQVLFHYSGMLLSVDLNP
ncbi:hypothetical protein GUJ93_ZPchr0003g17011 [Zizania palustris]|uniref:Uncharacterized protein n=1 Tax=Zizania palustris TaxID=103762 RepID=A0A8J5S6U7_ZIZPA|nr:hypothetical protein GUJ93_ZPchr0003g17011 [Zizania palustris]